MNSSLSIGQRYRVFLNEKSILILEDINTGGYDVNDKVIEFHGKTELVKEYERFKSEDVSGNLIFNAKGSFDEACMALRTHFKEIKAAGGLVLDQWGRLLCIYRLGFWDLPKGKLKKNEMPESGAKREVSEETGLTGLSITKKLPSTFHIYVDRKGNEILKETYWFEMSYDGNETPVPQTEEDITSVNWFSKAEIPGLLRKTYASLKELIAGYM